VGYTNGFRHNDRGDVFFGIDPIALSLGAINALRPTEKARYFFSIDFRDPTGAEASAALYIEGDGAESLLRALARIGRMPLYVDDVTAAKLPGNLPVTHLVDPLGLLEPDVPLWPTRLVLLPGQISGLSPDGSVAVLDGEVAWDVATRRDLATLHPFWSRVFSPDGRVVAMWNTNSSGPFDDGPSSTELTIVDLSHPERARLARDLPGLGFVALSSDAAGIFALHATVTRSKGGLFKRQTESVEDYSLLSISGDPLAVTWRAVLPLESMRNLRGIAASAKAVVVYGPSWLGVWDAETGEPLYASTPAEMVPDLVAEEKPPSIVNAGWLSGTLVVEYTSAEGDALAVVDPIAGRTLRDALLPSRRYWLSRDRAVYVLSAADGLAVWDTAALAPVAIFDRSPRFNIGVRFDTAGRFFATAAFQPEGLPAHVIVWNRETLRAVGQCLFDDATGVNARVQLAPDGRAVLGYRAGGNILSVCGPPATEWHVDGVLQGR